MNKDEYILRCLSKIRHKNQEHFVLSRIIHALITEAPDIEFVCQQLVRLEDGKRALTDMYFPQFDLHLEIDERHHIKNEESDKLRSKYIVNATSHNIPDIPRIKMYKKDFTPWDYEGRYKAKRHIEAGIINLESNAVFRYQKNAKECFGYKGGHSQNGGWHIRDKNDTFLWCPKLYENGDWDNEHSDDGTKITERKIPNNEEDTTKNQKKDPIPNKTYLTKNRIVFAHTTDELGKTFYRFLGLFDNGKKSGGATIFNRISTEIDLAEYKRVDK